MEPCSWFRLKSFSIRFQVFIFQVLALHVKNEYNFWFQANHENDTMMLIVMIFEVFYSFCMVFIPCELGERLMSEYENIEYVISQFDWYLLPAEVQRILPTIIINAQQAVNIQCFGSTNTSRESFQRVRWKKSECFLPNLIKIHNFLGIKYNS